MPSILALSAKGASFLILVQICSRSVAFLVNQLLLRHLSPELFGVSMQLELYSLTILYFARESFRTALQRPTESTQVAVNVAYIPLLLGLPIAFFLGWLYSSSETLASIEFVREAFALTGLSSVVKLMAEPCFAAIQQHLLYSIRARAEASAAIARCIGTYAAVLYFKSAYNEVGALPFAIGLLASTTAYSGVYYFLTIPVAKRENFSLLPRKLVEKSTEHPEYIGGYFSRSLCSLSMNLYLQSGVKYTLTQGDALLITSLASLRDQGSYALATNYGSLLARVLFQPVEESSRNLFAKLCLPAGRAADTPADASNGKATASNLTENDSAPKNSEKDKASLMQASEVLSRFLHLYALLSLLSVSLGPPLAPLLLNLVAGARWAATNAPEVLATYTYYIPFLAVNGVTEAFVAAVASNVELRQQSSFFLANFTAFALAAWGFVSWAGMGAQGLVWACCVGLGGRCVFNAIFIHGFFGRRGVKVDWSGILPSAGSIAAAVAVIGIERTATITLGSLGNEVYDKLLGICAVGAGLGIAFLFFERRFLVDCYRMIFQSS